jgi:heat shock protein HtpX
VQVFGLYTQIEDNRRRTGLLLGGFGLVFAAVLYALCLLSAADERKLSFAGKFRLAGPYFVDGLPWAIALVAIWFFIAYRLHQRLIDFAAGARDLPRDDSARVHGLLETLCISRGLTTPALKVIEDPALNAYASGLDSDHSAITLTRGLIDGLTDAELQTVLAHELTHIRNRDARLVTICAVFVGMLGFFADLAMRGSLNTRALRAERNKDKESSSSSRDSGGLVALIAIAILALSYVFSLLIQAALSQTREYLADSGAVELTKDPDALISALLKISDKPRLARAPSSLGAAFIEAPNGASSMSSWFATHPPLDARIDALVRYAGGRRPVAIEAQPWGSAAK